MNTFLGIVVGYFIGLFLTLLSVPTNVTVTYSEDAEACFFAQGYKAAAGFVVNEEGEPLLKFVPKSGDLRACANIGEQL